MTDEDKDLMTYRPWNLTDSQGSDVTIHRPSTPSIRLNSLYDKSLIQQDNSVHFNLTSYKTVHNHYHYSSTNITINNYNTSSSESKKQISDKHKKVCPNCSRKASLMFGAIKCPGCQYHIHRRCLQLGKVQKIGIIRRMQPLHCPNCNKVLDSVKFFLTAV